MTTTVDLYETQALLHAQGAVLICGVDEAGRGPLAGPVVAGAVILPRGLRIEELDDSKKLSESKRERVYARILESALAWSVGIASEREIDEINILQATFCAMRRAVENLGAVPDIVLVDGNQDPRCGLPTRTIVQGDARCASIAAGSVIAKSRGTGCSHARPRVTQYGFARHKGYASAAHAAALRQYGPARCTAQLFEKFRRVKRRRAMHSNGRAGGICREALVARDTAFLRAISHALWEIDIIAPDGEVVAFVEVKTGPRIFSERPAAAVTPKRSPWIAAATNTFSGTRATCSRVSRFRGGERSKEESRS
jgi:ribonuclease HII